ncbi:MAG: DMT family transporter [Pseudomonadota bacterium]
MASSTADAAVASTRRATTIGFGAVLLWALLAPLGVLTAGLPPFLTTGLAFLVAAAVGFAALARRGRSWRTAFAPAGWPWVVGVGGLFGFHALYFTSLRYAPAVEASLITYLWPLLIVLLQALLPGGALAPRHLVGALMGLSGTVILVSRDGPLAFSADAWVGYLAAGAAALTWGTYSVVNRLVGKGLTSDAVTGFCTVTAALALAAHLLVEPTPVPGPWAWLAVIGLGLGPVGLAFFLWDHGTKHGDLRVLGVSAYAAPLLSTLILVAVGLAAATPGLALAVLLIVGGAAWASDRAWRVGRRG